MRNFNKLIILLLLTGYACTTAETNDGYTILLSIDGETNSHSASLLHIVDGEEVGKVTLKRSVPLAFTASETFDVGTDLGSPVSLNYSDRRPFAFDGKINSVDVKMK